MIDPYEAIMKKQNLEENWKKIDIHFEKAKHNDFLGYSFISAVWALPEITAGILSGDSNLVFNGLERGAETFATLSLTSMGYYGIKKLSIIKKINKVGMIDEEKIEKLLPSKFHLFSHIFPNTYIFAKVILEMPPDPFDVFALSSLYLAGKSLDNKLKNSLIDCENELKKRVKKI